VIEARDLAPVTPLGPGAGPVTVTIGPAPPEISPELADATERRWAELLAENPRHFDGPILAIERFDPATNTIHARRDGYKRLAVQPQVETGVRILSVTGFITALDERSRPCVLLAQRSNATRIYGGLWELAPSGGIDPPRSATGLLDLDHVRTQLASELKEELGTEPDVSTAHPIALCVDGPGHSVDVVVRVDTGLPIDAPGVSIRDSWEYTGVHWLELTEAPAFAREHADELIPSTREMLRSLREA